MRVIRTVSLEGRARPFAAQALQAGARRHRRDPQTQAEIDALEFLYRTSRGETTPMVQVCRTPVTPAFAIPSRTFVLPRQRC